MKKFTIFTFLIIIFTVHCTTTDEPLVTHLYGYIRNASDSTTGINGLILQIRDINPYDFNYARIREDTTRTEDSLDGFFEMDSVVYGTTGQQGTGYVAIFLDSLQNPGWSSWIWYPTLFGEIDTIILYLEN